MADSFKIVLLGEGCVGKTSLVLRYVNNAFNPKHVTTIQASFLSKRLNIDGSRVTLAIWDTAGQERFHALGPIYYRDANGALLVYDITDHDSFVKVQKWVKELRRMLGRDVVLTIVGNKVDLERQRNVTQEEAESYAKSVGARHMSASAKLNKGIDALFLHMAKEMLAAKGGGGNGGSARGSMAKITPRGRPTGSRQPSLILTDDDDDTTAAAQQGGCCN